MNSSETILLMAKEYLNEKLLEMNMDRVAVVVAFRLNPAAMLSKEDPRSVLQELIEKCLSRSQG